MRFVEADEFDCSEVRILVLVLLITGSGIVAVVAEPTVVRFIWVLEEAMKMKTFWVLVIWVLLICYLHLGFVVHLGFGVYEDLHMHKRIYNNSK
ncbi:hypothetical protein HanRHA438_Chr04g0165581 [Helianthus annuus]|nr:hypothetical protein HanLR1_Chr00c1246g0797991 [Helianthus annuus]KAJ0925958.1 hypothetical protein HanRHA438_Chr04g0165581 [Helianthus annuus]KAJ0930453.1 hypothetical protein HanPSC8_Chr04g0149491 [Helianthus annuus]